jgi:hypothetical protein
MTATNAINADQREPVDFDAFEGTTVKHRKSLPAIQFGRHRLNQRSGFKSQGNCLAIIGGSRLNGRSSSNGANCTCSLPAFG